MTRRAHRGLAALLRRRARPCWSPRSPSRIRSATSRSTTSRPSGSRRTESRSTSSSIAPRSRRSRSSSASTSTETACSRRRSWSRSARRPAAALARDLRLTRRRPDAGHTASLLPGSRCRPAPAACRRCASCASTRLRSQPPSPRRPRSRSRTARLPSGSAGARSSCSGMASAVPDTAAGDRRIRAARPTG